MSSPTFSVKPAGWAAAATSSNPMRMTEPPIGWHHFSPYSRDADALWLVRPKRASQEFVQASGSNQRIIERNAQGSLQFPKGSEPYRAAVAGLPIPNTTTFAPTGVRL